jgi:preprotein translocase subunit SecG
VWAPEPIVTPKAAVLPEPPDDAFPPPIPNWERASVSAPWPEAPREHASSATRPPRPVHSVGEAHRQHSRRSRAFMTAAVLASLFVVFVVVMVVVVLLHHSDNPPAGTASTASAVSPETARLQGATKSMNSKVTAAHAALHSLNGIPTTVKVAAVINPYVSSLRRYEAVLSGAEVPTSARGAAAAVRALLTRDAQSLATIDGLPSLLLGSYLEGFDPGVTQLHKDLRTLEHALGARTT